MARLDGRKRRMLSKAILPTQYAGLVGPPKWQAGPFGGLPGDGRFEYTVRKGTWRIISRVLVTQCDGRTSWRTIR